MRKLDIGSGLLTGTALCLLLIAGACSLGDDAAEDTRPAGPVSHEKPERAEVSQAPPSSPSGGAAVADAPVPAVQAGRGGLGRGRLQSLMVSPQSIVRGAKFRSRMARAGVAAGRANDGGRRALDHRDAPGPRHPRPRRRSRTSRVRAR